MAKPTIVTRATKGSALTWTEGDANFTNLKDATVTIKAGTGGTDVVSDLNGTVTLVAGTNVTLTGDNTAKTVTINASGGGGDVVDDTTPQLGGDLDVNGNDITAALDANVNIVVTGEGTINLSHGDPDIDGGRVIVGDGVNPGVIVSNGATDLILGANSGAATIAVGSDGFVFLTPGSGSSVDVESSVTRLGTSSAAATLTTNGAYNLTLSTNNGTVANVPTITLTSAGGIALQATTGSSVSVVNSTLVHNINSSTTGSSQFFSQAHATADANNFTLARARNTTLSPSAVQTGDELAEFYVAGHDGQTGLAGYEPAWGFNTTVTSTPSSNVMPVRTDYVINTGASTLSTYHSIGTDLVFRVAELGTISGVTDLFVSGGTNGDMELSPDGTGNVFLSSDTVRIGDHNTAATLTTYGTGNLILNTHNGTNSGSITIAQGNNGNITLAPNGTGKVVISGVLQVDGTTTTVNSTTVTVDDPIFTLGGDTAPTTDDNKDRGIEFRWHNGTTAKVGFFGYDDSTGYLTFIPDATNTSEVFSGTQGDIQASNFRGTLIGSVSTNAITGVTTNSDIVITPNGTGDVDLVTDTVVIGDANAAATLTTNGTGNLTLNTNNGTNSGTIQITQGTGGNIDITPNGSGRVGLLCPNISVGFGNNASVISTTGTGNLTLSTNQGTNSGTIQINQGANAGIAITPNGTGDVVLEADTIRLGDLNSTATVTTNGAGNLVLNTGNGATTGSITVANGANGNITLAPNGTGQISFRTAGSTGDIDVGSRTISNGNDSGITINVGSGALVLNNGLSNATQQICSGSNTQNLRLRGNNFTGGFIDISGAANGNILLTPDGTGQTVVKNLEYNEYVHALGTTSGTITPDAANGNVQTITLNGNLTLNAFSSPVSGQTITFIITQDGTGSRTLTSTMKFAGGSKTLTTAANSIDILTVSYIGTTYYASLAKGFV